MQPIPFHRRMPVSEFPDDQLWGQIICFYNFSSVVGLGSGERNQCNASEDAKQKMAEIKKKIIQKKTCDKRHRFFSLACNVGPENPGNACTAVLPLVYHRATLKHPPLPHSEKARQSINNQRVETPAISPTQHLPSRAPSFPTRISYKTRVIIIPS